MPPMRVYVDSPLTVKITEIFKLHPECFDAETRALLGGRRSPFELERLRYVGDVEESKAIDAETEPSVIISASGMCEAGRVVHHLRATIGDPKNCVVIVGYQAVHTLGRRIVERRREVPIFGVPRPLNAEVVVLDGFSAHADQQDLIDYAEKTRAAGPLRTVVLVHGEPPAQNALAGRLGDLRFPDVRIPGPGEHLAL